MPNPYHDETGKFCSAGEMNGAIHRLISEGRWEQAKELRNEYKAIVQDTLYKGYTEADMARSQTLMQSGAFGDTRETLHPDNLRITESWTDDELEAQREIVDQKIATLQEEINELNEEKTQLNENFKKENKSLLTPREYHNDVFNTKMDGEALLEEVASEARKAGISSFYIKNYLKNRVAPALGIADGLDRNSRRIPAEPELSPINENTIPKAKEVDTRQKLADIFKAVAESPAGLEYNAKAAAHNKHVDISAHEAVSQSRIINSSLAHRQRNMETATRAKEIVTDLQKWRATMKAAGISPEAKLSTAASVAGSLKVDKTGAITNAWGVNNGTLDRIVGIKKLEYPQGSAQLVGESGKTYYDSEHSHSFKTQTHTSYLLVDPKVEGESFTKTQPEPLRFFQSIDSGD